MASTLSELVLKGGKTYFNGSPSNETKDKFAIIGSRYGTLASFKRASIDTVNTFTTEDGNILTGKFNNRTFVLNINGSIYEMTDLNE